MQINRYKTVVYTLRSLIAVTICSVPPLIETYKDASIMPIPPHRESIESVDMVLHIPIAIEYFYEYLRNMHNPDGVHWFALYIDLRLYDSLCQSEEPDIDEIVQMAQVVKSEYIDEDAKYLVELDPYIKQNFLSKFTAVERYVNDESTADIEQNFDLIYIEIYAFVLDKLREYFEYFKKSNAFVALENEITKKERLYEILVEANLIANQ